MGTVIASKYGVSYTARELSVFREEDEEEVTFNVKCLIDGDMVQGITTLLTREESLGLGQELIDKAFPILPSNTSLEVRLVYQVQWRPKDSDEGWCPCAESQNKAFIERSYDVALRGYKKEEHEYRMVSIEEQVRIVHP